ncbi:MAG TPA: enoyl-CoA hydratase-related protein [Gemmatimonadaceae bacterium]|nr:enoyl-CoA hydratase-related protein [Gemmatimonadaceae bacterium]
MSAILVDEQGAVGVITMNRRERFNAFDVRMAQDFRRAALRLARDERIRAVVLRGAGGVFSSGADLKYIRGGGAADDLAYLQPDERDIPSGYGEVFKQILEYLHSTISEIRRAPKPFVAAVDGMAAAGGLGLAMACDLVFASSRASFEWAYGKTGLSGAESITFFLPRILGFRKTMGLALLNPRLSAEEALDAGLINGVFPAERFDEEIAAVAQRLAAGPTAAFAATKRLVNQSLQIERLDSHMDVEIDELARSADSEDFRGALDAFFEKRAAAFGGR